ncbi:tetratricopeptide (TPR) repeat protein [Paenibacillus polymyxa]|uniref:J domain-containing protein n=1 Tax=Paenibacillus polymyxa TaxID=1406 RepID=UPI00279271AF|nr:tetratricopeptide repeat protein [Paenibacillus polymyxa]MDQ0047791.1 tetratricopeptide (TPR) repeat protein [Paenibacillus polymyxa]
MDIWTVLGVTSTSDLRMIKRAYAQKLKLTHPEDDPAGYQRLREAYDQAMRIAKSSQKAQFDANDELIKADEQSLPLKSNTLEDENCIEKDVERPNQADEQNNEEKVKGEQEEIQEVSLFAGSRLSYWQEDEDTYSSMEIEPLEQFMERVEDLYLHYPSRVNLNRWLELLNDSIFWNVSEQNSLSERILIFLEEHHFLPPSVWELLEKTFMWREASHDLPDFIELYPNIGNYAFFESFETEKGYIQLLNQKDMDHETYFNHRELAYISLMENKLEKAGQELSLASQIFADDPDLIRLQMEFFRQSGDVNRLLEVCNHAVAISPEEMSAYLVRADLLIQLGQTENAKKDINLVLSHQPAHRVALNLAGKCYMYQKEWEKAEQVYRQLLRFYPNDPIAGMNLAEASHHLLLTTTVTKEKRYLLRKELGRTSLSYRLKRAFYYLFSNRKKGIIALVFFVIFFSTACSRDLGMSPVSFIFNLIKPVEFQVVHSADELEKAAKKGRPVRVMLNTTRYIDLHQIKSLLGEGENQYMTHSEAEEQGLFTKGVGYISVGYLGNYAVAINTNYDQASDIYKNGTITLEGMAYPLDSGELLSKLEYWKSSTEVTTRDIRYYPFADAYLETQEEYRIWLLHKVSFMTWIYGILMIIFSIIVFPEIRRAWRFLRYN